MENFLVFRLYGPMAAWGKIAVGEERHSYTYPSRSAILGIISAALGIKRNETEKLSRLFASYDVAIKALSSGSILKDYHTVQVPDSVGKTKYSTRRDELIIGKDRLGTILTSREYRSDALAIVALRMRANPSHSFQELMEHLKKPKLVLYLGRKSCPLAAPLNPQIILAKGFRSALDEAEFPPLVTWYDKDNDNKIDITHHFIKMIHPRYYWEGEGGDIEPQQTHERYDQPLNRNRWQFAPRQEHFSVQENS
jgi:CRISPR system Cascade subunit CasD